MSAEKIALREARNVDDLKRRDGLVRRIKRMREDAVLDKASIEWFNANRLGEGETPLSTEFEDALIAWCDGKGPLPSVPERAQ